jgi:hypothetical protein
MSDDQAKELVNTAFDEIHNDARSAIIESLKELEQQIHNTHGDPETRGQTWAIVSSADRQETDSFIEDRIQAVLTGEGDDMYAGLKDRYLAIAHSLVKGKIGTMIRTGAWQGPLGGERPSEHPDRLSCVITAAYTANHVFFLVRTDDGKVQTSSLSETEYMEGRASNSQALVDALLDFDYLPTALKEHEPEEYEKILDAIIANGGDTATEE